MADRKNGKRNLEEIFEEHLEVTKRGFEELRAEMQQGFKRIEGRLDNMLITSGTKRRDHETRITALELDVAKLKAG
jgi:hypothetical protein